MVDSSREQRRRVLRGLRARERISAQDRPVAEQFARMSGTYVRSPARKALFFVSSLFWLAMLGFVIFGDASMAHPDDQPIEAPATWENVAVGKAKEVAGSAVGDEDLTAEGEDQEEIAHEVREGFKEEHQD